MATMQEIEKLASKMAMARDSLTGTYLDEQEEIQEIKNAYLKRIRKLTADFKAAHALVVKAVEASPELFVRPRSVILHGIKAGFQKGKGAIGWDDNDKLVARIERLFTAAEAEALIKTTKKPIAAAISDLSVDELKQLGVTVEGTGDTAFAKLADSDIAKMIKALLTDAPEEETA